MWQVQRLHSAAEEARRLAISLFFGKRKQTRHPLTQQTLPVIAGTRKQQQQQMQLVALPGSIEIVVAASRKAVAAVAC